MTEELNTALQGAQEAGTLEVSEFERLLSQEFKPKELRQNSLYV